jgi:hypothetical protein
MLHAAVAAALLLSAAAPSPPAKDNRLWPARTIIGDEDDEPPEPPVEQPPPRPTTAAPTKLVAPPRAPRQERPSAPMGAMLSGWQARQVVQGSTMLAFGVPLTMAGATGAATSVVTAVVVAVAMPALSDEARTQAAAPALLGLIPAGVFLAVGIPLIVVGQNALIDGLSEQR